MNDVIEKIAAQTGLPTETVAPVVGALLSHMGDILPAPIAHQLALFLGIHQEEPPVPEGDSGLSGLLGGLPQSLAGGGTSSQGNVQGGFAGADSLVNVAQSLLGGLLSGRR